MGKYSIFCAHTNKHWKSVFKNYRKTYADLWFTYSHQTTNLVMSPKPIKQNVILTNPNQKTSISTDLENRKVNK